MGRIIFWDGIIADSETELASGRIGQNAGALTQDDKTIIGYTGRDYDPNPHNVVSFDDIRLPGVCKIKGLTKCNVKNKKAPGTKGNKPTVLGYAPAEFDVIWTFWTSSHLDLVEEQVDRLWNIPMANPHYLGRTKRIDPAQFTHSVDHPWLQLFDIFFCVINQVGLPYDGKVEGTRVIEIKCTENRDPGKRDVTATPKPAPVKRHVNFNGPPVKNSSQLPPPSQDPANMSLVPPLFTPAGGGF